MRRPTRPVAAAVLVLALLVGACADDDAGKGASPTATGSTGAVDDGPGDDAATTGPGGTAAAATDGAGTGAPAFAPDARRRGDVRDFPLAVGTSRAVGDEWEVEVVGYDPDATEEVLAANGGNEPPPDGEVFALARIRATYVGGDERANAFLGLEWALVDDAGEEHTDADCGVLPDDLASQSAVPPGATAEGTICSSVPADRLGQVVLYLRPLLGAPSTHVWWSAPADGAGRVLEG